MILWLFDKRNQHGFLPNLIKDETLEPNTSAWWDLAINPPFSLDFTFLNIVNWMVWCKTAHLSVITSLVQQVHTTL